MDSIHTAGTCSDMLSNVLIPGPFRPIAEYCCRILVCACVLALLCTLQRFLYKFIVTNGFIGGGGEERSFRLFGKRLVSMSYVCHIAEYLSTQSEAVLQCGIETCPSGEPSSSTQLFNNIAASIMNAGHATFMDFGSLQHIIDSTLRLQLDPVVENEDNLFLFGKGHSAIRVSSLSREMATSDHQVHIRVPLEGFGCVENASINSPRRASQYKELKTLRELYEVKLVCRAFRCVYDMLLSRTHVTRRREITLMTIATLNQTALVTENVAKRSMLNLFREITLGLYSSYCLRH